MKLNSLPTKTMLQHSERWLNDPEVRDIITAHPLGMPLLDELRRAHLELARAHGLRSLTLAEIDKLNALMDVVDDRHDDMARALYWGLQALIHADPVDAMRYHEAQQVLFPEGLHVIDYSYADESCAALAMKARVVPSLLALLDGTRLGKVTLGGVYRAWLAAGEELGRMFQKRAQLQVAVASDASSPTSSSQQDKRRSWIKAVRALLASVELMELTESQRQLMLSAFQDSVSRSQRRRQVNAQADSGMPMADNGSDAQVG